MKPFLGSRFVVALITLVVIAAGTVVLFPGQQAAHAAAGDWPTFLAGDTRSGFNGAETIINHSTASQLKLHWIHSTAFKNSAEQVEAMGMVSGGCGKGIDDA